jgi:LEA14-like dessication related protein
MPALAVTHGRTRVSERRGVLLLLAFLVGACASMGSRIEAPQVSLESVRLLRIVDGRAEVSLGLRLSNSNTTALVIRELDYEITLDGRPAASGRTVPGETLPPNGETKVDVYGRVDTGVVATAMMALGSQLPVAYTIRGTVTAQGSPPLPFSRKGDVTISRFEPAAGSRGR